MRTQVAEALAKRPDAPKCVVAARPELETGAAARLLWSGAHDLHARDRLQISTEIAKGDACY